MGNARNAERHSKENTTREGSSLDELIGQWSAATADICTVRVPASHFAKVNSRHLVRAHCNSHRELSVLALLYA